MSYRIVRVFAYSGYRGEELPRAIVIGDQRIDVVEILELWVEEGFEDRSRRRFFKIRGSDGEVRELRYDEEEKEWRLLTIEPKSLKT